VADNQTGTSRPIEGFVPPLKIVVAAASPAEMTLPPAVLGVVLEFFLNFLKCPAKKSLEKENPIESINRNST